jgi:hypothetical protein
MTKKITKFNPEWISVTRKYFLDFLEATGFPHPERNGMRGSKFNYPEWLIMLIAVLAVKCKVKSYLGIHKLAVQYWEQIAEGENIPPISESQLRDRLKKICHQPGKPAGFIQQIFPLGYLD